MTIREIIQKYQAENQSLKNRVKELVEQNRTLLKERDKYKHELESLQNLLSVSIVKVEEQEHPIIVENNDVPMEVVSFNNDNTEDIGDSEPVVETKKKRRSRKKQ